MKSLVHTEELCSRSVPLEDALGAKSFALIIKDYAVCLAETRGPGIFPVNYEREARLLS